MLDSLGQFAFFLSTAFVMTWIAYIKKYYSLPFKNFQGPSITLTDVFSLFFIFIASYFLLAPIFHGSIFAQVAAFFVTATLCFIYSLICNPKQILRALKDKNFPGTAPFKKDAEIGLFSFIVALPVVSAITSLTEILTSLFTSPTNKEQVAVKFLKESLAHPSTAIVALFSILIVAPLLEEFLFRGILFSYLRTKIGPYYAIFTSSLIFTLFHFSPSQSIENFPLLLTLFALGSYLAFAYEKTRSLSTSILLHVTFNSISVIRIIFIHV